LQRKKVLLVTYYWPPSGGAGVQRWFKFVKYLPAAGIEPLVVTVDATKASYPVLDNSLNKEIPEHVKVFRTNTFEPFNLYKKITGKQQIPFGGFANEGKPSLLQRISRFVRGNFFIPDARIGWNKYAFEKCCKIIESENIEVVITTSPPHSTQLIGLNLKEKYKIKWIADLRDPWIDIYYYNKMNHTSWAKKTDVAYEKKVLESADQVIVSSNSTKVLFQSKSDKINPDKIHPIPNGFDIDDFNVPSSPSSEFFTVTYSGTVTEVYGLAGFVSALKQVIATNQDVRFKIKFVGSISDSLLQELRSAIPDALEIISHVQHKEAIHYLMKSTALLMAIPNPEDNRHTIPGKLFEYLAARKPIICIGLKDSDVAKIIQECDAGKSFLPSDIEDLTSYLNSLVSQWKQNPNLDIHNETYKKYSRYNQTQQIAEVIKNI